MLQLNTIHNLDVLEGLKQIQDRSIHCIITSPPYFNLRDYKINGQIGAENSLQEYIDKLTNVFMEVYRVLRDDGTFWLNIGDSYASSKHIGYGLKAGDLCGVPWRLALSLQSKGWYLRSDIIWAKGVSFNSKYAGSCMPESVKNRPSKSHEYMFLLTKSKDYYYDHDSVKEPIQMCSIRRAKDGVSNNHKYVNDITGIGINTCHKPREQDKNRAVIGHRNIRSVWTINEELVKFKEGLSSETKTKIVQELAAIGVL